MLRKPYVFVGCKLYKCVVVVTCLALTWVRGVTETKGQINLWGYITPNLSSFWSIVWIPLRRLSFFLLMNPKEVILRQLLPSDLVG